MSDRRRQIQIAATVALFIGAMSLLFGLSNWISVTWLLVGLALQIIALGKTMQERRK